MEISSTHLRPIPASTEQQRSHGSTRPAQNEVNASIEVIRPGSSVERVVQGELVEALPGVELDYRELMFIFWTRLILKNQFGQLIIRMLLPSGTSLLPEKF